MQISESDKNAPAMPVRRGHAGWLRWCPFVLLCVLRGSRWILSDALPGSASTLASEAVGCGSVAALALLVPMRWRLRGGGALWRSAAGGAMLVCGPLVFLFAPTGISSSNLMLALTLTPVVVAVAVGSGGSEELSLAGRLWPGLAAVAGLLLILPSPELANPLADALLVMAPLLTGCGAVLFCTGIAAGGVRSGVAAALAGAAVCFGVALVVRQGGTMEPLWGIAAGLDGAEALLMLLALERLSAMRWAAQFTLVPLLVLVEGLALVRMRPDARAMVGLVLLLVATVFLLLSPVEEQTRSDGGEPRS